MSNRQERLKEITFLIFLGVFLFAWAVIQPLNVSPDEKMRYQICQYIYEHHALPHGGDPAIRDAIWGYSYAFLPILPQIFGALFMGIASWFSKDPFVLLMAARMVSILCGVGMAWFLLRIGEGLWKKTSAKWLFTILAALLPQSIFLFSYLNNDSMALLATAMMIYAWVLGSESGWSYKSCMLLALGIIICALTYYNAYGVILSSILLFGGQLLLQWKNKEIRRGLLKKGALIAAVVLLGISWWFIRNYMLYDGDFLGLATSEAYSQQYAIDNIKPSNRLTPYNTGQSLWTMLLAGDWLKVTVMSFVGCFGYLTIPLKLWMYLIYAILLCIGLIASLIYGWRHRKAPREQKLFLAAMLLTAILPNVLNLFHSYYVDFQPQGRYSMPMLLPFMYFVTTGWMMLAGPRENAKEQGEPVFNGNTEKNRNKMWLIYAIELLWIALALLIYMFIYYPQIHM